MSELCPDAERDAGALQARGLSRGRRGKNTQETTELHSFAHYG